MVLSLTFLFEITEDFFCLVKFEIKTKIYFKKIFLQRYEL